MFLKTLTLKGFKSFADSTTLTMEPGVTVVVGPNGSGKSNVVDAIGWVLGAQAPSAVRSGKMDDVIFAGTSKRAALGRAEVSLTIDNSSGLLPIEFTEVTITRTLFRSGDSEYALNGVPCRLLDVQELLSDTGMGRQQHVIISQGQIDAVLNARPEDRRLIIEEAAGVLKFRRRKEKAERRLAGTEANLTRIEDMRREVRRQLGPLEKQADAARRHQSLVDELVALRIHLAGRDLARLRDRLADNDARGAEVGRAEREIRVRLAEVDTELLAAEATLMSEGGRALADELGHCESLREKARGLRALIAERRRRVETERNTEMDRTVVATLEAEAAELAAGLGDVENAVDALGAERDALETAERELDEARASFADRFGENLAAPTRGAADVRGELAALQAAAARGRSEIERLVMRQTAVGQKSERLSGEIDSLQSEAERLDRELGALDDAHMAASDTVADLAARNDSAESALRDREGQLAAWTARVETLESALDAARARAGVEHLSGIAGVVGTLLDVVEVDEGYAVAFEAGAGEALAAVVVEGLDGARAALDHLRRGELDGAILSMGHRPVTDAPVGAAVAGMSRLRAHVRSTRAGVDDLLDLLLGAIVVAQTVDEALETVLAHPDATVVTRGGDRFAPSGWRISNGGSGATGGALHRARQELILATSAAASASDQATRARSELASGRDALATARSSLDRTAERLATARARLERARSDHEDALGEALTLAETQERLASQEQRDEQRRIELEEALVGLEAAESEAAERARRRGEAQERLDDRAVEVAQRRSEFDVRVAGLHERRGMLQQRTREVEERLARDAAQRAEAGQRRAEHERTSRALASLDAVVTGRLGNLDSALGNLRERRQVLSDAERERNLHIEDLRSRRTAAEAELEDCRNKTQQLGLAAAELRVRIEQIVETLRGEHDVDPSTAMEAPCPELADGVTPVARVRDLERELRAMGTINPLALSEFEATRERHEFLVTQLDDVKATRRELTKVIREVDAEIMASFTAAYADVRENFIQLFSTLFPGGSGDLSLTDPENPLETGIEIKAKPSGKNVRTLSLLSGGERSLVALAYLFAVFRSRSSPFYVMDEVEAALDDVNLHRFLDLIAEFRSQAQLIIVSHQKRTMEAADALFGVTMQPGGSSKVVSERV